MSRLQLTRHLTRRDAAALALILLGLFGMVRHFSTKPETAAPPARQAVATTFTAPALPRFSGAGETARPSEALKAMRRRLREFVIPWPGIRSLTASDALAVLQHHWQTLPHETDAVPPATFRLSEAASQQLAAASPPLPVSLEIPGVSLLTQLQLLAAQTELHLRITENGAVLEPLQNQSGQENQSTVLRLEALTLQRFISRAQQIYDAASGTLDESAREKSFLSDPDEVQVDIQLLSESEPNSAAASGEVTATISDDGYTIDLNLVPEVIDFEAFLNYGTPIQTTGINSLGESEPVFLPDARVTQPVFSTRLLPGQKQTFSKLLESVGIPERATPTDSQDLSVTGYQWDPGFKSISVTGPPRIQRIASATIAAIQEAANAGATLEFATGAWQNNRPPAEPTPASSKIRPASVPAPDQAATLSDNKHTHQKLRCGIPMSVPLPRLRTDFDYLGPEPGSARSVVVKAGARFRLDLTLSLPIFDFVSTDTDRPSSRNYDIPAQWMNAHHWHRIDLPDHSGLASAPRQSLFVRINPATIVGD